MRFYTKGGKKRPITPRKHWYYYSHPARRPSKSSFSGIHRRREFRQPMPQNTIRSNFSFSDDSKKQIEDDILSYVAGKFGDEVARALAPAVSRLIPSTLGPNIQHDIKIEQERHGVKASITASFPVDISSLPWGAVAQTIAGKPTFYVTVQSKVRLYKQKRLVATNEISVGYSQESPLTKQGVGIEWHKTFKPASLKIPKAVAALPSVARQL